MVDSINIEKDRKDTTRNRFKKTKLCSFYRVGTCRFGDQCEYAHSEAELEVIVDLKKTSLCVAWLSRKCPHTKASCRFAHGKRDLRDSSSTPSDGNSQASTAASTPKLSLSELVQETEESYVSTANLDSSMLVASRKLKVDSECIETLPRKNGKVGDVFPNAMEPMKVTLSFAVADWSGKLCPPSPLYSSFDMDSRDIDDESDESTFEWHCQRPLPNALPLPSFILERIAYP